jgi:hypothetical protein
MGRAQWAAGLIVTTLAIVAAAARAQDIALEQVVKAAFVPKFAPFVEWPEGTLAGPPDTPFVICAAGNDGVGKLLDEAAQGQTQLGRPIVVRAIQAPAAVAQCHILYVGGLREEAIAAFLEAARGRPILTVTNAGEERRARGVIDFSVRDNKVRFDIDLIAAAQQHLTISSKLLNLALRVRSQP